MQQARPATHRGSGPVTRPPRDARRPLSAGSEPRGAGVIPSATGGGAGAARGGRAAAGRARERHSGRAAWRVGGGGERPRRL
eukprot:690929-Prymnesium_polylepis.1